MLINVLKPTTDIEASLDLLFWLSEELAHRGIIIRITDSDEAERLSPRADVTLIQAPGFVFPYPEGKGVLDRFDGVIPLDGGGDPFFFSTSLEEVLGHPHVKKAIMGSKLPLDILNTFGQSYHIHLLKEANPHYPEVNVTPAQISQKDYEKICLFPFYHGLRGWQGVMRSWQERTDRVKFDETREFDFAFMGKITGIDGRHIEHHRVGMAQTLLPHPHKRILTDRLWGYKDYCDNLLKSKICISPWGCLELCWRDAEAMFAGCVLIKPQSDHVITQFPYFISDQTYVPVKLDWSDLVEKIDGVLANWDDYYEMRRSNQERIYHESSPEFLADYLAKALTF